MLPTRRARIEEDYKIVCIDLKLADTLVNCYLHPESDELSVS